MRNAISCWNCSQGLPAGTARCPSCGVPLGVDAQGAPAPAAVPSAHGGIPAPAPAHPASHPAAGSLAPLAPAFAPAVAPASVGSRVAAFTIDVVAVAVVVAAAAVLTRSFVLTVVVAVELLVGLLVLQARTGLGLGNALLRLRVSQGDVPFSPGLGRAFVRGFVTGAGALIVGAGAWVVEASAAWDRSGRRRSWADRAAGTVVVAVPRRAAMEAAEAAAPAIVAPPLPSAASFDLSAQATLLPGAAPVQPALLTPPQLVVPAPVREVDTDSAHRSQTGSGVPAGPGPVPSDTEVGFVGGETGGELLVIFDTGQREQLPVPVAVNFGRAPEATDPGDRLVVVRDPEHTVSKTHARLEHTFSGTWITDNGSTNGTELLDETGSARRLAPGARTPVEDGVRVRLGNRVFTISRLLGGAS